MSSYELSRLASQEGWIAYLKLAFVNIWSPLLCVCFVLPLCMDSFLRVCDIFPLAQVTFALPCVPKVFLSL